MDAQKYIVFAGFLPQLSGHFFIYFYAPVALVLIGGKAHVPEPRRHLHRRLAALRIEAFRVP